MKCTLRLPMSVEDTVRRISERLEDDGFIVEEEDATFAVTIRERKAEKVKSGSRFWCRKGPLSRPDHAMVIEGEVTMEESGSLVDAELIEYHANRAHAYGGTTSLFEYFDKFLHIFEE